MSVFPAGDGGIIEVNVPNVRDLLDRIGQRIDADVGFSLATLNLDHLVKLQHDDEFRDAYRRATFVVADGNPVVMLARIAGEPVSLAPGSDLIDPLCALAAEKAAPVALFGSRDEVLAKARATLTARHPKLRIVLVEAPPFGFDPAGVEAELAATRIRNSGARLCFLCLGSPKQEIFASHAQTTAPQCGFASIGAGIDFIAGAQRRAPMLMRRLALEWLWRLISDRVASRAATPRVQRRCPD